jgi:nucleoside-diphosphate-sugar epimerase
MRIFLTGASGFIGSRVLQVSQAGGHDVLCLRRPHTLADLPFERIADFRPEVCIHCAWIATPGVYQDSPANADHQAWGLSLVEQLSALGTRRFVMIGSCAEYAASATPLGEDHPLVAAGTPYAAAKCGLRQTLRVMQRTTDFDLAWLRVFFPFGVGEHPQRLFSSVARACREGDYDPAMIRFPHAVRDYVHVDDVAAAIVLVAERSADGDFNVGTGRGIEVGAAASLLARMLGVRPREDARSPDPTTEDMVVAAPSRLLACGWRPRHDLESGLAGYSHHFRGEASPT